MNRDRRMADPTVLDGMEAVVPRYSEAPKCQSRHAGGKAAGGQSAPAHEPAPEAEGSPEEVEDSGSYPAEVRRVGYAEPHSHGRWWSWGKLDERGTVMGVEVVPVGGQSVEPALEGASHSCVFRPEGRRHQSR